MAASFIGLIGLGNLWYVDTLFGKPAPSWLQSLFGANLIWLFLSAAGLVWHILRIKLSPITSVAEDKREDD